MAMPTPRCQDFQKQVFMHCKRYSHMILHELHPQMLCLEYYIILTLWSLADNMEFE